MKRLIMMIVLVLALGFSLTADALTPWGARMMPAVGGGNAGGCLYGVLNFTTACNVILWGSLL